MSLSVSVSVSQVCLVRSWRVQCLPLASDSAAFRVGRPYDGFLRPLLRGETAATQAAAAAAAAAFRVTRYRF